MCRYPNFALEQRAAALMAQYGSRLMMEESGIVSKPRFCHLLRKGLVNVLIRRVGHLRCLSINCASPRVDTRKERTNQQVSSLFATSVISPLNAVIARVSTLPAMRL